ncbi:MAG: hypothetical protein MRZ33_01080, partial [Prevotella sp.]|nr:hypothetical protein [Prevotella sp.]
LLRVEPVFRTFIPSPSIVINEFTRHKGSANRRQYKINSFIFIVEMQPNLSKVSAKIRLSKTNGNLFLLLRCSQTY